MMLKTKLNEIQLDPKYSMRPVVMADLDAAVGLFNRCSQQLYKHNGYNATMVGSEWRMPKFDLANSTRSVWNEAGELVGYIEVWDIDNPPVDVWVWARVHPDFEGEGIGSALMAWGEQRARQAIARVPEDLRVYMQSATLSGYKPAERLFEDNGLNCIRYFHNMVVEFDEVTLAQPQWPEGITIRTLADADITMKKLNHAVEDAFKDHWGNVEKSEEEALEKWQYWLDNDPDFDPTAFYVAMDGDEIAGMSLCHVKYRRNPAHAYVDTLGVRRPWRRRGLALALLQHSFSDLRQRGKAGANLEVDASSLTGATRLYERAGMYAKTSNALYEKELRPGRDISTQQID